MVVLLGSIGVSEKMDVFDGLAPVILVANLKDIVVTLKEHDDFKDRGNIPTPFDDIKNHQTVRAEDERLLLELTRQRRTQTNVRHVRRRRRAQSAEQYYRRS